MLIMCQMFSFQDSKTTKIILKPINISMFSFTGRYQAFGELALIYPNRKRNASVIAEEKTQVLAISYEIFEKTLQVSETYLNMVDLTI